MRTKIIEYLTIALLVFSSILSYTKYLNYRYLVLITGLLLYFLNILIKYKSQMISFKKESNVLFFYLFIILSIISSIVIFDFQLLIIIIGIFSVYFVFATMKELTNFEMLKFVKIILLIPIILSVILTPITKNNYQGIFYNPNALAIVALSLFTVTISELFYKKISFISMIIIFLSMIVIVTSSSRTSFLTMILIIFLTSFNYFRLNKKSLRKIIIIFIIAIIIISITPIKSIVYDSIILKFINLENDALNGRLYIWKKIISESTFFGNGRDYLLDLDISAHNTYLSILSQYGFIGMILFILFLLNSLIKSLSNKKVSNILKINFIALFMILSMAESMILSIPMIIMFAVIFKKERRLV